MSTPKECMSCGSPAVTGGRVPLCSSCNAAAQASKRGVTFEKAKQPTR